MPQIHSLTANNLFRGSARIAKGDSACGSTPG